MTTVKLCAYIKTSDGRQVLCRVVKYPIYDFRSFFPLMAVRAIRGEPLNAINKIYVPMAGLFTEKEKEPS